MWGLFLKSLTCSLEHSVLICEGAMHIHNSLVDQRNDSLDERRDLTEDMN